VDPPPVVELKIFDIENGAKTDVTFAYDANFFLFATLEMARPMAHGRVAPPATQVPVLTGMPVSGMAYLDRPSEAGYFIFPDLSVRHEGKYRLSFNLYEETKQDKDADKEPTVDSKPKAPDSKDPDSSFDWRMELKSDVFDVFSAKKFPGLAESTALSRTVAEQGCRVRIRRDVRMRRRGEGKGNDDFEDEMEYNRLSRAESTDFQRERSRASSAGSEGDRAPYDPQRPNSGEWIQPGNHLTFGQQYAQQPQFATPQPPVPPSQSQYQGPGAYHQPPQYNQAPPPPPQAHYGYDRQYPQSAHPSFPAMRERVPEDEWRRQSMAGHANEQFARHPAAAEPSFSRQPPSFQGYTPRSPALGNILPPLQIASKYDSSPPGPLPPARHLASIAPAVHSPTWERREDRPSLYAQQSAPLVPAPTLEAPRNGKRTYESTFGSAANSQPLVNGMRPSSPHDDPNYEDDDDNAIFEEMKMNYKRADGSHYSRALPSID
jgi:hypothetical protein